MAPFFAMDRAFPAPLEVHTVAGSENQQRFNVPFRSLDAGEGLRAVYVQDIEPDETPDFDKIVASFAVAADDRPISEQGTSRTVSREWVFGGDRPVSTRDAPTTLTIILAHESNFDDFDYSLRDPLESAQATWLFAFEPSGVE